MTLAWYTRFDNFVSIMGGFPITLSQDYIDCMIFYCQLRIAAKSDVITWKLVERTMRAKLIAWRMSFLYARGSRGQISRADFTVEHDRITQQLVDWRRNWDPDLTDPRFLVNDFGPVKADPDGIVNPYEPGVIYKEPLFGSTVANFEWHCMILTHRTLAMDTPRQDLFEELSEHALAAFQHYEAMTLWPAAPLGLTIIIQAAIPIAAIYLPQDHRHRMWVRRRFALSEQRGSVETFFQGGIVSLLTDNAAICVPFPSGPSWQSYSRTPLVLDGGFPMMRALVRFFRVSASSQTSGTS